VQVDEIAERANVAGPRFVVTSLKRSERAAAL
jgi:hypothetical protein